MERFSYDDAIVRKFAFALLIATGALVAFIWATRRGQSDDLETPSYGAIFDDAEGTPDTDPERAHGEQPDGTTNR